MDFHITLELILALVSVFFGLSWFSLRVYISYQLKVVEGTMSSNAERIRYLTKEVEEIDSILRSSVQATQEDLEQVLREITELKVKAAARTAKSQTFREQIRHLLGVMEKLEGRLEGIENRLLREISLATNNLKNQIEKNAGQLADLDDELELTVLRKLNKQIETKLEAKVEEKVEEKMEEKIEEKIEEKLEEN